MAHRPTLGILGGNGWLGGAFGRALLTRGLLSPDRLAVTSSRHGDRYADWPDVVRIESPEALLDRADIVVLALRPAQFATLTLSLESHLVISLMAQVSLAELARATGATRLVRAMPNAAAEIGRSYTPWVADTAVNADERRLVGDLLAACGPVDEVGDEHQLDYLTALTGSGPAFPALLAASLIEHALDQGLPEALARRAVVESLAGSLALIRQTDADPGAIVDRFLAYGGITTLGLESMVDHGFRDAVKEGVGAAHRGALEGRPSSG
ncbi:MAG: hypothetical protein CMN25_03825 [Salinicola sp.]|nr:hypothetical protein [Salinicola sp.]